MGMAGARIEQEKMEVPCVCGPRVLLLPPQEAGSDFWDFWPGHDRALFLGLRIWAVMSWRRVK